MIKIVFLFILVLSLALSILSKRRFIVNDQSFLLESVRRYCKKLVALNTRHIFAIRTVQFGFSAFSALMILFYCTLQPFPPKKRFGKRNKKLTIDVVDLLTKYKFLPR